MSDTMEKVKESPRLKISRFWAWCKTYETIRTSLSWGIIFLFLVLIAIMLSSSVEKCFVHLTGIEEKPEILKFIGWGISGLIAILVAIGLLQRTAALDEQNKIAEKDRVQRAETSDKQNKMTEKGHIHERFKVAIEHLGIERISVRIAAFYEFYRLAEIEPDLKEPIFDILCAHLRKTTTGKKYKIDMDESEVIKPTEEIQSLLNILFKSNKDNFIFDGLVANLEGVYLQGADLDSANLKNANLQNAKLENATLVNANMQEVFLKATNLYSANLYSANLQNAKLGETNLKNTSLQHTKLQHANFFMVNLQGAFLPDADLKKASLIGTKIDERTTMPDGWKDIVEKCRDGKTGVLLVDDKENIIEHL